jgi:hypothetical protein
MRLHSNASLNGRLCPGACACSALAIDESDPPPAGVNKRGVPFPSTSAPGESGSPAAPAGAPQIARTCERRRRGAGARVRVTCAVRDARGLRHRRRMRGRRRMHRVAAHAQGGGASRSGRAHRSLRSRLTCRTSCWERHPRDHPRRCRRARARSRSGCCPRRPSASAGSGLECRRRAGAISRRARAESNGRRAPRAGARFARAFRSARGTSWARIGGERDDEPVGQRLSARLGMSGLKNGLRERAHGRRSAYMR